MRRTSLALFLTALGLAAALQAQSPAAGVPRLIPASGMLFDEAGKPLNGNNVKVTFSVYAAAGDGAPLWSETLKLTVSAGRYDALIGSSSPDGIPASVFAAGEARWLGVTADKAVGPPRSLLVSVPYALTSDDAAKLGGYPASAFILKDERVPSNTSPSSPSGWKQAVEEEAAVRSADDTKLQTEITTTETELNTKIDVTKEELDGKLDLEKTTRETKDTELETKDTELETKDTELETKIDLTKTELETKLGTEKTSRETKDTELDTKIDLTKTELDTKILLEKSNVIADGDAKLLLLKQELTQDSTQKVNELDQKKTSKEEFELEKQKKQLDIDDLKQKKTSKEEFELEKSRKQMDIDDIRQKKLDEALFHKEKLAKDWDIDDIRQKKLDKLAYDLEKAAKDAELADLRQKKLDGAEFYKEKLAKDWDIDDLRQKKLEKSVFDTEKATKEGQIQALHAKIDGEKARIDGLSSRFVVTFERTPNGPEIPGQKICPDQTVAIGIVGQTADPLGSASPFCSPVNGATIRADGRLSALLTGPNAVPGLGAMIPDYELMCLPGHAVVGVFVMEGQMSAVCRRLFSTVETVSEASVAVASDPAAASCGLGATAAGLDLSAGFAMVCR